MQVDAFTLAHSLVVLLQLLVLAYLHHVHGDVHQSRAANSQIFRSKKEDGHDATLL